MYLEHGYLVTARSVLWDVITYPRSRYLLLVSKSANGFRLFIDNDFKNRSIYSIAWINGLVNNREAGDLRRHRIRYDVTVMITNFHVQPTNQLTDQPFNQPTKPLPASNQAINQSIS